MAVTVAPGRVPLLGHGLQLAAGRLEFLTRVRDLGDVVQVYVGRSPAYVVNDRQLARRILGDGGTTFEKGRFFSNLRPLLGNGLGTSEGAYHLRQRRMVQPVFHHSSPVYDLAALLDVIDAHVRSWRSDTTMDIAREMDDLGAAMVLRTLFTAPGAIRDVAAIRASVTDFLNGIPIRTMLPSRLAEWLPTPGNIRFRKAQRELDRALDNLIDRYVGERPDHTDVLSMLLDATDAAGNSMSRREVRDEMMSLLVAGVETIGHVLAWVCYELGQRLDIEDRLVAELDDVLADRPLGQDDLKRLPFLDRVINEALRLHNIGWIAMRRTATEVRLGDVTVPAGTELIVSATALDRDPAVFPDAMRFDPDRWLVERGDTAPRKLCLPFGAGSHHCAGEPLARLVLTVAVAELPRRVRLRPVPGRPVREQAKGTLSAKAIPMTMLPRQR